MPDINSHPGNSSWSNDEKNYNYEQDDLNSCIRVPYMSMLKKYLHIMMLKEVSNECQ